MGAKEFDYYIFIDYSESWIGYIIIKKEKIKDCLLKISRFRHYKEARQRKLYLKKVKNTFKKNNLLDYFYKKKIRNVLETPEIFMNIAEFLNKNKETPIFISVDNRQYKNFEKFVKIIDGKNVKIVKESDLKKHTFEYKINLVLDSWLNIERTKHGK